MRFCSLSLFLFPLFIPSSHCVPLFPLLLWPGLRLRCNRRGATRVKRTERTAASDPHSLVIVTACCEERRRGGGGGARIQGSMGKEVRDRGNEREGRFSRSSCRLLLSIDGYDCSPRLSILSVCRLAVLFLPPLVCPHSRRQSIHSHSLSLSFSCR